MAGAKAYHTVGVGLPAEDRSSILVRAQYHPLFKLVRMRALKAEMEIFLDAQLLTAGTRGPRIGRCYEGTFSGN